MTDRPILFSAPMVRALLAGTKSQTRRIIKPQPPEGMVRHCWYSAPVYGFTKDHDVTGDWHKARLLAYRGDRLWVRETWSGTHAFRDTPPAQRESYTTPDGPVLREDIHFWADGNPLGGDYEKPRPGIHMPRWASRLTLTVTDVKVERLQDINAQDCWAEGCSRPDMTRFLGSEVTIRDNARNEYRKIWEGINGEGSWKANPWVVAYTFTVQRGNIDQIAQVAA